MTDHAKELLALRDGSPDGELLYRRQVIRLLGADPVPGLDPPAMVRGVRRAEGTISIPDGVEDVLTGLVVFAIGNDGRGSAADVRSKHAEASARSLLMTDPTADFVVLVTTEDPSPALLELAEAKSDLIYLGGVLRRRIWVMGLAEVVARGEALVAHGAPVRPWWKFWGPKSEAPASPLLLDI